MILMDFFLFFLCLCFGVGLIFAGFSYYYFNNVLSYSFFSHRLCRLSVDIPLYKTSLLRQLKSPETRPSRLRYQTDDIFTDKAI